MCVSIYSGTHTLTVTQAHMLSQSPKQTDIKAVIQLFLIHNTEKTRAGEIFCFNSESSMRKIWV